MDPLRRLRAAERFARARELRLHPTPAERHAWTLLRNRGILGLKFRRQHVLHGFIVDFYCPSERIVIELEGERARYAGATRLRPGEGWIPASCGLQGHSSAQPRRESAAPRSRATRASRIQPLVPPLPKG